MLAQNINEIVNCNLCIGCGLCSVACPESVVSMTWQDHRVWQPEVDEEGCTQCGRCLKACPHSPQCIAEYAAAAQAHGVRFGLPQDGTFFIAYDKDESKRIRSASGGVTSALLEQLLSFGTIDGVLASQPLEGTIGEPHFQMKIFRSVEDLDRGRSSHYHPLSYDKVLHELREDDGTFAVVGVPCVLRGIVRLPSELQKKIKYRVSLVCSHNVTGAFSDCLAGKEGVDAGAPYQINLRDKVGIPDANKFNNLFELPDRKIRRNRFSTAFTDMWRNYFFAQECCLYCPDFYGVDADISIKDAWGRLSMDPLGTSLVIVNNSEVEDDLLRLESDGRLFLEACDADEIFNSQTIPPIFKHEKVRDRLVWKKSIKQELDEKYPSLGWQRRWLSRDSHEYWRLWSLMKLSELFYFRFDTVPVKSLLFLLSPLNTGGRPLNKAYSLVKKTLLWPWRVILCPVLKTCTLFAGYRRSTRLVPTGRLRVLVSGGYGYGNVGDEAQLAANIQHWRKAVEGCRLTVLTPNPEYTQGLHEGVRTELAPRKSLFGKAGREYFGSDKVFRWRFFPRSVLLLFNACLIRANLPVFGATTSQSRLLDELKNSDVLFLSGGGYLTGMTLTRLWDNMLLIRLAHAFGVPVIMSGQTVGVFKDRLSHWLAKWGLSKVEMIYLRDHVDSPKDLAELGIPSKKIKATFDDALFFAAAPSEAIDSLLAKSGVNVDKPYLAVNVHYWGQEVKASRVIMKNMAAALDRIYHECDLQIVFVPMVKTDEVAIEEVRGAMHAESSLPVHEYRPELAVGLIQNAHLCVTMKHHPIIFAMAAAVPTVSMTFDDYYHHKNFGAMKIFGQEDFLIEGEPEQLELQIVDRAKLAVSRRDEISDDLREVASKLRENSGEVILWFVKERFAEKGSQG